MITQMSMQMCFFSTLRWIKLIIKCDVVLAATDTRTHAVDFHCQSVPLSFLPSVLPHLHPSVAVWTWIGERRLPLIVISNLPVGHDDRQFDWPTHDRQRSRDWARSGRLLTAQDKWNCVTSLAAVNISTAAATAGRSLDRVRRRRDGQDPGRQRAVSSGHRISDKHFAVPSGTLLEPRMRRKWAQNDAQLYGSTTFVSPRRLHRLRICLAPHAAQHNWIQPTTPALHAVDITSAVMVARRIRGKIIRTVPWWLCTATVPSTAHHIWALASELMPDCFGLGYRVVCVCACDSAFYFQPVQFACLNTSFVNLFLVVVHCACRCQKQLLLQKTLLSEMTSEAYVSAGTSKLFALLNSRRWQSLLSFFRQRS